MHPSDEDMTPTTDQVTEDDIGKAIMGLMHAFDAEYDTMTKDDLADRWHYKFDSENSSVWNMYRFYDALRLYAGSCRRWEEKHNGSSCVVERVRDTYIIPKIKEFEAELRAHYAKNEK